MFRAVAYIYKDIYTLSIKKYNDVKHIHFYMRFVIILLFDTFDQE